MPFVANDSDAVAPTVERRVLAGTGNVLFVRHGRGQGPARAYRSRSALLKAFVAGAPMHPPEYMAGMLDYIQREHRDLRARITTWETGSAFPSLENISAVVFLLKDPLKESFPKCYEQAMRIAEDARSAGIRVVNPPDNLSNSIKTMQSRIWHDAGVPTPKTIAFETFEEMHARGVDVEFPLLLRADWLHCQQMMVVDDRKAFLSLRPDQVALPGCLVPLIDTREGYRQSDPDSEFARYYHKKRVWVVGERVQPAHLFFSSSPIVGSKTSTFAHYRSANPIWRFTKNLAAKRHIALDRAYFHGSEPNGEMFVRAVQALGLDIAAVDYSSYSDGRVVMWEANPYFALEHWPWDVLERQRDVKKRHLACYDQMRDLFLSLIEADPEAAS